MSLPEIRKILCLGAHADDIEIGCGGTLLRWLREDPSIEVEWIVLSGNAERSAEARSACRTLLGSNGTVVVESFRDSYFPAQYERLKGFLHAAAERRPQMVFTHAIDDAHQDHRLLGEMTQAVFREQMIWQYEIPKYDGDLGRRNVYVPLDEDCFRGKVNCLLHHYPSQAQRDWFDERTFSSLARLRGIECRAKSGLAEAFTCHKFVL